MSRKGESPFSLFGRALNPTRILITAGLVLGLLNHPRHGTELGNWLKRAWEKLRRTKLQEAVDITTAKDPYVILGLNPRWTPADMVNRYRELAHKYRRDGTKPDAERFKKIQEAYGKLLSDLEVKGVWPRWKRWNGVQVRWMEINDPLLTEKVCRRIPEKSV